MNRIVANSVVTTAFFFSTATIRSRMHLFPSAGTTAGHYPVLCDLKLFGKGIEARSVRIDGNRLNQPDGIRLEEAFPLRDSEGGGVYGLEIRFECDQGRINLCNSRVVIEIVSAQFSFSFSAKPFAPFNVDGAELGEVRALPSAESRERIGIAVNDLFLTPSLVIINPSQVLLSPDFSRFGRGGEAPLNVGTVAPYSVVEFPLNEALCSNAAKRELLSGTAVVESFWINPRGSINDNLKGVDSASDAATYYILHREPKTKRPLSVCAL